MPRIETRSEREYPTNSERYWDRELPWQTIPFTTDYDGDEATGTSRREVSWNGRMFQPVPINDYQALMECAPGEVPKTSAETYLHLREVLADAIDTLDDFEREVFDGVFVRNESLQTVANRLGTYKMKVWRVRNRVTERLRVQLQSHPAIREYLERHTRIEET